MKRGLSTHDSQEQSMSSRWNRRELLTSGVGGLLGACLCADTRATCAASDWPPNLLFVFPDQMRGQALGFLKEDPVLTPSLDRFAAESLVLTTRDPTSNPRMSRTRIRVRPTSTVSRKGMSRSGPQSRPFQASSSLEVTDWEPACAIKAPTGPRTRRSRLRSPCPWRETR